MIENKHNIVYKITNSITNRIYIGIHSTDDLSDGYLGSSKKLKEDIKTHGVDFFTKELLFDFDTRVKALEKERAIVDSDFVSREDTYNENIGGYAPPNWLGKKRSEQHRAKMREIGKNRIFSAETRLKFSESAKRENLSDETLKKMSDSAKRENLSSTTLMKMSLAHKGKNHSSETKLKMSLAQKGVKKTPEHIAKVIEANKGNKHSDESKSKIGNASRGKVMIFSETENAIKRVSKEELDGYLSTGLWIRGRKKKTEVA